MKMLVLGTPESLPSELADNPDVIVLDPSQLDDDMLASLDAAVGGMLFGDEDGESGEGDLVEWAEEEEKEHAHADEDEAGSGYGDDEDVGEDEKDDRDEEEDGKGNPLNPFSKKHLASMAAGMGDDEDEDEEEKKRREDEEKSGERGGKRGGRGGVVPPLSAWARAMSGRGR